jgi:anthranilate 1,2-dioxygenase (deaminating, decarboxylating) large subunit
MKRTLAILAACAALSLSAATPAAAFNQPPMNLGLTDILDGGPPGPGTYFTEYLQAYSSDSFKDKDGNGIPGDPEVATLLSMNQLIHVYPHKLGGAHLGADLLVPVVSISTSGGLGGGPSVTSNPALLGDVTVGPFLQWFDTKLLGRPFLQRVELDVSLPVGQYDSRYLLNPGSNTWVVEPYYAFTWFLTPELSTSWRLHYTYSTENDDAFGGRKVKPGQAFHANYSVEYAFRKNFRAGVAGYYLKQLTEDEVNGVEQSGSKEQVFAAGPAVHWIVDDRFSIGLKTAWEMAAENRPQGSRSTLRFTYKF